MSICLEFDEYNSQKVREKERELSPKIYIKHIATPEFSTPFRSMSSILFIIRMYRKLYVCGQNNEMHQQQIMIVTDCYNLWTRQSTDDTRIFVPL